MSVIPGWDTIAGSHWWSNFYFWGSIVALILLGITEVVSHRYSEHKDELTAIQETKTQREHEEAMARLNAEAEKANNSAKQAELELALLKTPRQLRIPDNFSAIGKEYLSGVKFELTASEDFEAMSLAIQVRQALVSIGMIEQLAKTATHWTPPNGAMPIGTIVRSGVSIRSCDPPLSKPADQKTPARILGSLLGKAGLGTKDNPVFLEPWEQDDCAEPDVLHVEIGVKPLVPWHPAPGEEINHPHFQITVPKQ